MKNRNERKKILLLSDDCRFFSGVGTQSRELMFGTIHHYNWVQMAGGVRHQEAGKIVDLSVAVAKETGIADAYLKLYPVNNYGDSNILFNVIEMEKPDALMCFTDPRYWVWLFQVEDRIRTKIPLTFLTIWDCPPHPMWNRSFYMSCDALFPITHQTYNLVKWTLRPELCTTINGDFGKDGRVISTGKVE